MSGRRIDRLLAAYGESHQHVLNKAIHWIAVPVIFWSVLALLSALPFPETWRVAGFDWAGLAALFAVLYNLTLSPRLALGMAVFCVLCLFLSAAYTWWWGAWPLWQLALAGFLVAWILQFIGHAVEGRRPSFLQDLRFLLIGPLWLLAGLYRALGIAY
jgi:uncharacterized membrane protein YGL010W